MSMAAALKITRRRVLSPSSPPACVPDGSIRTVPLTAFDRASPDSFIPCVLAWNAPTPDNAALIDGLLATVARYPHLAARMGADERGRRCLLLDNAGVLVIEAAADADLADALASQGVSAHVNELYPKADKECPDEPLFQVQLTRYRCGGLVIGAVCQHQVADGASTSSFNTAWAAAVRTGGTSVLPSPFTNRAATAVPRNPLAPASDHHKFWGEDVEGRSTRRYDLIPTNKIQSFAVHFPEEFVAGLKARVGARCSTFQCLLAHAWKKVTEVRGVPLDEVTQVRVAVNCRSRASPPVPADFFGNMVLWAFLRMHAGDLVSLSYATVVGAIRDAVARVDAEHIQSFVDFAKVAERVGEKLPSMGLAMGTVLCPDMEVDSWLGFRLHDLDFGCGPVGAFLPPDLPIEGLMFFVPSTVPNSGVKLFLALDREHVEAFKQICYTMDD
ncbi:unnamed protein product [Urochloa decumbens]|uniref:Uncharacterized protein n=1 Tax=Urochloa decumbens TaxID=240449 RepID=A0ABC9AZH1_9POAL